MYKSPIELLVTDIQNQIVKQQDEEIYKAVLHYVPNVDKEELLRALQYDRDQYEKGYMDGMAEANPKWIPVTERLPELHGDFITAIAFEDGDILIDISVWYGKCWETLSGEKCNVTHWMPLPEPPKEGAEDGN